MRRIRFFCNLAALAASLALIVAAAGFEADALEGVGLGLGSAGLLVSLASWALLVHQRPLDGDLELRLFGRSLSLWIVLAAAITAVGIWEIVAVTTFPASVSRWLTLANGITIALLACGGVIAHERTSQRIVHILEIVERPHH